jgi:hypothetical protein
LVKPLQLVPYFPEVGEIDLLRENTGILEMCRKLGFEIATDLHEPSSVIATLPLSAQDQALKTFSAGA